MPAISKTALVVGLALLPHLAAVFGRPFGEPSADQDTNTAGFSCGGKDGAGMECPVPGDLQLPSHPTFHGIVDLFDGLSLSEKAHQIISGALLTDEPDTLFTNEEAVIQHFMQQIGDSDKVYAQSTPFGNFGVADYFENLGKDLMQIQSTDPIFHFATAAVVQFSKHALKYPVERSPYSWKVGEYMLLNLSKLWGEETLPAEQSYLQDAFTDLRTRSVKFYNVLKSKTIQFSKYLAAEEYTHQDQFGIAIGAIDKAQALALYIFDHLLRTDIDKDGENNARALFQELILPNRDDKKKSKMLLLFNKYVWNYGNRHRVIVEKLFEECKAQIQTANEI
ncbi:hypothetical protein H4R35_001664 [Dimargaris xerosporica]|nr:hypothetical protein H4R35_001664 [Dimargaris xerosporica]